MLVLVDEADRVIRRTFDRWIAAREAVIAAEKAVQRGEWSRPYACIHGLKRDRLCVCVQLDSGRSSRVWAACSDYEWLLQSAAEGGLMDSYPVLHGHER